MGFNLRTWQQWCDRSTLGARSQPSSTGRRAQMPHRKQRRCPGALHHFHPLPRLQGSESLVTQCPQLQLGLPHKTCLKMKKYVLQYFSFFN